MYGYYKRKKTPGWFMYADEKQADIDLSQWEFVRRIELKDVPDRHHELLQRDGWTISVAK